jgi:hypothetical protein
MKPFRSVSKEYDKSDDDKIRLWNWVMHEDNLLSTRISFFLLAQSILIAVTAALVNTLAGLHGAHHFVRVEVFGLAISLDLAGAALTLMFWYIFNMNENGLIILTQRLQAIDEMYRELGKLRRAERQNHWYFRTIFRRNGPNVAIKNLLAPIVLFIWLAMLIFAVAIYLTD